MAAIDKIYGSPKEHTQFKEWITDNRPEFIRHFYECYPTGNVTAIANFPRSADKWLLENCTLPWVIDRINDNYGIVARNKQNRGGIRPSKGRLRR